MSLLTAQLRAELIIACITACMLLCKSKLTSSFEVMYEDKASTFTELLGSRTTHFSVGNQNFTVPHVKKTPSLKVNQFGRIE